MKKPTIKTIEKLRHDPYVNSCYQIGLVNYWSNEEILIATVEALVEAKNNALKHLENVLLNSASPCLITHTAPDTADACPACRGKGYISYVNHPIETCLHCNGSGHAKKLAVQVS